ncbi:DUF5063 domain-containing protein [Nocardioides sp.]|jgi:hypothetical protein|uniref:DUF5063 domain-containing protein n=1 Tax=Nocardioides sp. TaxID=35761 RepID=UPI0031FF133D|nr:hypothetical protein [Nocardioides sp.]
MTDNETGNPATDPRVEQSVEMTQTVTVDAETEDFAQQIADQVESFLVALQAISREEEGGRAISLLLLELSQILLAGARLGAQADFTPDQEYQPDVGPDPDLDTMRHRLARILGPVDTYTFNFDPYDPELVTSQLSDDLTAVANEVANGLRHYRAGNVNEALWWWQFSYVSSWGNSASASLRACQSIVAHDRLDADFDADSDQVAVAEEILAVEGVDVLLPEVEMPHEDGLTPR